MLGRIFALLLLGFCPAFCGASTQGHGRVNLTGQIVEAACGIATDDIWQEIDFGTIPLSDFAGNNTPSSRPFHLHLVNCSLDKNNGGRWSNVSVSFDGKSVDNHSDMFAMIGEGRGIGVNITDMAGNKAVPGQALPAVQLQENNTDLYFNIHLARNEDDLVSGDVSSFIRFMVAYQ